ncbi:hypothetical protein BBB44_11040 [Bordetella bronchiseptica]|nr:hypothetical protein BBB44_11040 [Bordetella bronchiseptica]
MARAFGILARQGQGVLAPRMVGDAAPQPRGVGTVGGVAAFQRGPRPAQSLFDAARPGGGGALEQSQPVEHGGIIGGTRQQLRQRQAAGKRLYSFLINIKQCGAQHGGLASAPPGRRRMRGIGFPGKSRF